MIPPLVPVPRMNVSEYYQTGIMDMKDIENKKVKYSVFNNFTDQDQGHMKVKARSKYCGVQSSLLGKNVCEYKEILSKDIKDTGNQYIGRDTLGNLI